MLEVEELFHWCAVLCCAVLEAVSHIDVSSYKTSKEKHTLPFSRLKGKINKENENSCLSTGLYLCEEKHKRIILVLGFLKSNWKFQKDRVARQPFLIAFIKNKKYI